MNQRERGENHCSAPSGVEIEYLNQDNTAVELKWQPSTERIGGKKWERVPVWESEFPGKEALLTLRSKEPRFLVLALIVGREKNPISVRTGKPTTYELEEIGDWEGQNAFLGPLPNYRGKLVFLGKFSEEKGSPLKPVNLKVGEKLVIAVFGVQDSLRFQARRTPLVERHFSSVEAGKAISPQWSLIPAETAVGFQKRESWQEKPSVILVLKAASERR